MQDDLLVLFEKQLGDMSQPQQNQDDLVFNVVAAYIYHLMKLGNVPHHYLDILEDYLKEEVWDIYRKKTYGHYSLQDYRISAIASRGLKISVKPKSK